MKCWKCGKDLAAGADKCLFCGASMNRILPTTPTGKAMRTLYDRMGMQEVLSKKLYLTTALGDLLQNSQKLRNYLSMAMDSGMGAVYMTQIKTEGKPTSAFRAKVKRILTEDAGLSDKIALELMGYMDEMIGWCDGPDAQKKNPAGGGEQPRTPGGEQSRTPGGKQSQSQCAELEKLKAELYGETCRMDNLLKKLQPLKNTQTLQKDATEIYDQLSKINKSLLDMMININRNLNQPMPNPDVAVYARTHLKLTRMELEPLEKRVNELFRKAETLNAAQQNTTAQKNEGGCLSIIISWLLPVVVIGLVANYFPTVLGVIVMGACCLFILAVLGKIFKKK